jgi:signal peptidase II
MRLRLLLLAAASLLLVGCDHATKHWARSALVRSDVEIVPGVVDLTYTENRDVAFSLLRSLPDASKAPFLLLFGVAGVIFLAALWWKRRHESVAEQTAYALLLAGALGNLLDRMFRGYVVDFIHVTHWPVFNVADALLVAGGILLFLRRPRPAARAPG